ncbi:MAG: superoxide dismutase, Ni [Candidatus Levybacteria bacterium]|nr:superoxide dismutase, Ni [Candidatus Levybacteria bacterium]
MFRILITSFAKLLPTSPVYAHCDVPCGIYDPKPAQIAAATVKKMVQLIEALPKENATVADRNKFVRCVLTKEEHAQKCKEELLILWTDYFKSEHLSTFPNLHETFWNAAKLCSQNKQTVSLEAADQLVETVNEIAQMFEQSKKASA